jgi:ATP-binding cassette subfamily F protein 3
VANVVYHLEAAQLIRGPGSYANYLGERERIKRTIEKARKEAEKEKERLLGSAEGMRWMASTSQKKARQREGLIARAERIQAPDPLPPERRWSLEIAAEGTPKVVLEAKRLVKAYSTRPVIRNATLRIFRGDRIALIGPNGSGKTTLLRLLLGREWPDAGERELGLGVSVGFLDQHHHGLEPNQPLYEQFVARFGEARAAVLLGRMRFKPPHWSDTPQGFSGGERARAGLALLSGLRTGLLVLDEPTNHLEVELLEALERALSDYPGTLLLVSHDRTLVQKVATRYWGLENAILVEYPNYIQAEAAMLGKPAVRLNPFGDAAVEEEKPAEERDLEAERLLLLDRLNTPGSTEREYGRIRSDLLSVEDLLYRRYADEFYRPFAYRYRIKHQGLEIYADEEAGFWRLWTGQPTSIRLAGKGSAVSLTAEQHGKSFALEGRPTKQVLRGVLRILFELADAQVVRLGKSVYGRSQFLKVEVGGGR